MIEMWERIGVIDKGDTKRLKWVDFSKGLGTILVIIGHTLGRGPINALIFSIHMPLFFCVATIVRKEVKTFGDAFLHTRDFMKRYFILIFMCYISAIYREYYSRELELGEYLRQKVMSLLYFRGNSIRIGNSVIEPVGMIWFFVVLMWALLLFDLLVIVCRGNDYCRRIIVCILSASGVLLARKMPLFLNMDTAFIVMPFLEIGFSLRIIRESCSEKNIFCSRNWKNISLLIWGGAIICIS